MEKLKIFFIRLDCLSVTHLILRVRMLFAFENLLKIVDLCCKVVGRNERKSIFRVFNSNRFAVRHLISECDISKHDFFWGEFLTNLQSPLVPVFYLMHYFYLLLRPLCLFLHRFGQNVVKYTFNLRGFRVFYRRVNAEPTILDPEHYLLRLDIFPALYHEDLWGF